MAPCSNSVRQSRPSDWGWRQQPPQSASARPRCSGRGHRLRSASVRPPAPHRRLRMLQKNWRLRSCVALPHWNAASLWSGRLPSSAWRAKGSQARCHFAGSTTPCWRSGARESAPPGARSWQLASIRRSTQGCAQAAPWKQGLAPLAAALAGQELLAEARVRGGSHPCGWATAPRASPTPHGGQMETAGSRSRRRPQWTRCCPMATPSLRPHLQLSVHRPGSSVHGRHLAQAAPRPPSRLLGGHLGMLWTVHGLPAKGHASALPALLPLSKGHRTRATGCGRPRGLGAPHRLFHGSSPRNCLGQRPFCHQHRCRRHSSPQGPRMRHRRRALREEHHHHRCSRRRPPCHCGWLQEQHLRHRRCHRYGRCEPPLRIDYPATQIGHRSRSRCPPVLPSPQCPPSTCHGRRLPWCGRSCRNWRRRWGQRLERCRRSHLFHYSCQFRLGLLCWHHNWRWHFRGRSSHSRPSC